MQNKRVVSIEIGCQVVQYLFEVVIIYKVDVIIQDQCVKHLAQQLMEIEQVVPSEAKPGLEFYCRYEIRLQDFQFTDGFMDLLKFCFNVLEGAKKVVYYEIVGLQVPKQHGQLSWGSSVDQVVEDVYYCFLSLVVGDSCSVQ